MLLVACCVNSRWICCSKLERLPPKLAVAFCTPICTAVAITNCKGWTEPGRGWTEPACRLLVDAVLLVEFPAMGAVGFSLPLSAALMVKTIWQNEYVDMADMLPENLSKRESDGKKKRSIKDPMQWAQCFAAFTSVVAKKDASRVPDLLAYSMMVIQAASGTDGQCSDCMQTFL